MLDQLAADAEMRVVVLAGAGDKAFVSGADISQFEKQRSGAEAVQRYEEIAEAAQARLQTLRQADRGDDPRLLPRRRPQHRDRAATCASPPRTRASAFPRRAWAWATAPRR